MNKANVKADRIHVYHSANPKKLLDAFDQKPDVRDGFDHYEYKGKVYPGYLYPKKSHTVYILIDKPLK
jgi:hypothetical protein